MRSCGGGILLQEAWTLWLDTLLYAESLWFFIAIFISYLIGWVFLRLLDRYGFWALLFPAVLACMPGSPVFAWHDTQEMQLFFALGLLFAARGVYYDTHRLRTAGWRYALLFLAVAAFAASPFYVLYLRDLRTEQGPMLLLLFAGELLLTASAIVVLTELFHLCAPLKRFFFWLGQYTMELYCIHMFFVKYLMVVTPARIFPLPQALSSVYYFAVSTCIGIVCALLSRWILDRIPLFRMFMLGQWPAKQRKSDAPAPGCPEI